METGLIHLHKSLAHMLVLFALVSMILAVAGAGKKAGLAKAMLKTNKFGVLMLGRLIYVAGLGTAMMGGHSFLQPWVLAGIVLWGVVEVASKRMVTPELEAVIEGGTGAPKLIVGALLELVIMGIKRGEITLRFR